MKKVIIYCDGSCIGNPGVGGWGAILMFKKLEKEINGHCANTTNNRMELIAVISSLLLLKEECDVTIFTDSKYVVEGGNSWMHKWASKGWSRKGGLKNTDLWKQLHEEVNKHRVKFVWVKGHATCIGNIRADQLATTASRRAAKLYEHARNLS